MRTENYYKAHHLLKTMARQAEAAGRPTERRELETALAHLESAWNLMRPPPPANR